MGAKTKIEWTDATWSPVTGCTKVSPGCDHCYAESIAHRFTGTPAYPNGFDVTLRSERLCIPLRWKRPRRVFVNSMSDLFHADVPTDYIDAVFGVMAANLAHDRPTHTFQVLTKRHARMRSYLNDPATRTRVAVQAAQRTDEDHADACHDYVLYGDNWPLPNVWCGVSVETQQWADIRIPALLATPAAVRFLSCEPLLGPVDLAGSGTQQTYWLTGRPFWGAPEPGPMQLQPLEVGPSIDWVIVGGESGPGARPMAPAWAQSIRDQCQAAGVPFLFKQWGSWGPTRSVGAGRRSKIDACMPDASIPPLSNGFQEGRWMMRMDKRKAGRELDGRTWDEYPAGAA